MTTNVTIQEEEIPVLMKQGQDRKVVPLLYKKVFPLVKNYITKRSGRKDDAYDVFQDALMIFYRQIVKGTFNPKYKPYGYLYRLSINCWLNKIKKEGRMNLTEDFESVGEELTDESPASNTDESLLKTLFSDIGDKCIELLTYTVYNNMLMEDIMLRMGFSSVGAVKMQQMRCKQKLMKEIENNPTLLQRLKYK